MYSLGRLNSYVKDNGLGDGENIGEKVTLASQRAVREASKGRLVPTYQIAASMRSGDQVVELAGVDVHTMPPKAAAQALEQENAVSDQSAVDPDVKIDADEDILSVLWDIGANESALAAALASNPPADAAALISLCDEHKLAGLFPAFTDEEAGHIASDGKIPQHARWRERIAAGTASVDGLCTAAALAAFTKDQAALDDRIRGSIVNFFKFRPFRAY